MRKLGLKEIKSSSYVKTLLSETTPALVRNLNAFSVGSFTDNLHSGFIIVFQK